MSEEGQELASRLDEVVEPSEKDKGSLVKEHFEKYKELEEQEAIWQEARDLLGNDQKEDLLFILGRLLSETPRSWGIESTRPPENLLGIPDIARYIEVLPLYDASVLIGTEGAELLEKHPEIEKLLKELYTNSRLANAAFLGAYLLQEPTMPTLDTQLCDGVVREISFEPDFHGDFRIAVGESFRHGSLTPLGEKVPFAPAAEKKLFAAYHSVEPDILLAAMRYLEIIGLSAEEQVEIYANTLEKVNPDLPSGNFADFGDDNLRQYLDDIDDEEWWQKNLEFVQKDNVLMRSVVVPGRDDYLFIISIDQDRFVIKNVSSSQSEELPLDKEDIEGFLTLMISSPGGRTSAHTLVDMIIARLDQLKPHL